MSKETPVFSMQRGKIVSLLKNNPMTISELIKVSKIPRATLYHHLEFLKKRGLIYEKKLKTETGQPVVISLTDTAKPLWLPIIEAYELLFRGKK